MPRTDLTIAAIMRLALGVAAAVLFFKAGHQMRQLQSVSGDTVAEAFDHYVGLLSYGLGLAALMAAIPVSFVRTHEELPREIAIAALDADDEEALAQDEDE